MIKIPNFYASSPLHNENIISETDKDSILKANPEYKKVIDDHNEKNRSESIAGDPYSKKSRKRYENLESMKFDLKGKQYHAGNLIKD